MTFSGNLRRSVILRAWQTQEFSIATITHAPPIGILTFHCADNFKYSAADNPWGCPDKVLFKYVSDYIDKEIPGEKVFHIILTGTNHPPYTLNIDNEGFDREAMRKKLPPSIAATEDNLHRRPF